MLLACSLALLGIIERFWMAAMEQNRLQQNDFIHAQGLFLKNTPQSIGFKCCLAKSSLYVFSHGQKLDRLAEGLWLTGDPMQGLLENMCFYNRRGSGNKRDVYIEHQEEPLP